MPANEGRDADSAFPAGGSEAVTTAASGPDDVRSDLLTDDWKFILPNDTNFSEPLFLACCFGRSVFQHGFDAARHKPPLMFIEVASIFEQLDVL